ncbi:MAG: prepilin-type N-terminal cleavage/methylation domain-containing protein [Candidatus Binatia bacterium]
MRTSTAVRAEARPAAFTLVEVLAVVAIVAVAAAIVLPRLPRAGELRVEDAAWRLAERLSEARERAILAGGAVRVQVGEGLARGVRVESIEVGGVVRRGDVVELGAEGDALPARVLLAGDGGARAGVVLPSGVGRARVERREDE